MTVFPKAVLLVLLLRLLSQHGTVASLGSALTFMSETPPDIDSANVVEYQQCI